MTSHKSNEEHISITIKAITPIVPNFIKTTAGAVDVADLGEDALRRIGDLWLADLLRNATRRRESRKR